MEREVAWNRLLEKNLPLIKEPLPEVSQDKYGIVLGAGWSLQSSFSDIKAVRDNVVIYAVDAAVAGLVKNGIEPDWIVSVDHQPGIYNVLIPFCEKMRSPILFAGTTDTVVIESYKGPKYFWLPYGYAKKKKDKIKDAPVWVTLAGGTVVFTAIQLAIQQGCKGLGLLGVDFCFGPNGEAFYPDHIKGDLMVEDYLLTEPMVYIDDRITTHLLFNVYFKDLVKFAQVSEVKFYNHSYHSLLRKVFETRKLQDFPRDEPKFKWKEIIGCGIIPDLVRKKVDESVKNC